jgi:hypothetical protein
MKKMANFYCALALFALSASAYASNPGEGKWVADEVFRATNSSGSTGLLYMNSAYTIRDGEMSINTGVSSESVGGTDYTQVPLAIAYGVTERTEFGLVGKYIDSSAGASGMAGGEVKMKWRFSNQTEYLPASALALSVLFPAGDASLNEVANWGARLNLLFASEAQLSDTLYIGMYLDLGATTINDSPAGPGGDSYTNLDLGLLFPISDDKRLQFLVEFNSVGGRTYQYLGTDNFTAITPALRYASEGFKLTFGVQSRDSGSSKATANIGWEF